MNGNAHSLGSSFNKIPPDHNVAQANKHVNHYHPSSAKPRDHVSSHHERPEQMENNGFQQHKVAANSTAAHTHLNSHPNLNQHPPNQHPPNQQQHIVVNNEKRFKNYKLVSDPLLRKGAQKVYRYDGVPTNPREQPVQVKDPRSSMTILDKIWSHREPAELILPRFKIDKHYVGVPPAIEVSITNLNDNINNTFLEDMLRKFDNCEEIEILYHPKTNKHLGLAKVVFMTPAGARQCVQKIHNTSVMGNIINVCFDPFFKNIETVYESIINPPPAPAQTDASSFLDPNSLEKLPLTSDFVFTTDSGMIANDLMNLHTPSTSGFEKQSFMQSQGFASSQQWTDNPDASPIRESLDARIHNLIMMQSVGQLSGFLSEIDLSDINTSLRLSDSPDHRRVGLSNRIDDSDAFLGTPPSPFVSASEYLKWHKFTRKIDTGDNDSDQGDDQKGRDGKTDDDDDRMSLSSLSSSEKMDEINVTNGNHAYPSNSDPSSSGMPLAPGMWKQGMGVGSFNSFMAGKNLPAFNGSMMPSFMYHSYVQGFSRFSGFNGPSTLGLPADIFNQDLSPTKQWTSRPKEKENRHEMLISNILAESSKCLVKDLKDILIKDILKRIVENYSFKMFDKWWEDNERKSKSTAESKTSAGDAAAERSESTARGKDINIPLFNPLFNNSISQNRHDHIVPNFEFGLTRGMRMAIPKLPSFKRKIVKRSPNRAFNDKLSDISDDEDEIRKPRRDDRRRDDERRRRRRRHSVSSQSSRSSRSSRSSSSSSSSSSSKSSKSSSDDDRSSTSSSENSSASEKSDGSDSDSSDASASSASSKRSTLSSSSSASSKVSAKSLSSRSSRSSRSSLVKRSRLSPISVSPISDTSSPARADALHEESTAAPKLKHDDLSEISADNDSDLDTDRTDTADEDIPESELEEDKQLQKERAAKLKEQTPSLDISSIEYEATQGLMALSLGFQATAPPAPTTSVGPNHQAERIYQETFDNYFAFEHSYIVPRPALTIEEAAAEEAAAKAAAEAANTVPPAKPKGKVGRPRKEKLDSNNKENQQQKGRKRKTNETVAAGDVATFDDLAEHTYAVASEWRNAKRKNVAANDLSDNFLLQTAVDDVANKAAAAALPSIATEPLVTFPPRDSSAEAKVLLDFLENGIDEEDVSYLKRSFEEMMQENVPNMAWLNDTYWVDVPMPPKRRRNEAAEESSGRVHKSGCARTEGIYKQLSADKNRYFFQETNVKNKLQQTEREARTNQRRFIASAQQEVFGQSDLVKFNQLKLRKKQLKFSKSKIHEWGLFAMEPIGVDDMVIEYVGVQQRAIMADTLERKYEKLGIGSSYLFKIDSETIIDATLRGNVARFINHSCTPNCTAKVILVEGQKKIVIYSKQAIQAGEEITYDYKFPIEETNKIKCLCQTSGCRGFLN